MSLVEMIISFHTALKAQCNDRKPIQSMSLDEELYDSLLTEINHSLLHKEKTEILFPSGPWRGMIFNGMMITPKRFEV